MNCHIPTAAALEYACGSYQLSINAKKIMSSGKPPAFRRCRIMLPYRDCRLRLAAKSSLARPEKIRTKNSTRSCVSYERTSMSQLGPLAALSAPGAGGGAPNTLLASASTSVGLTSRRAESVAMAVADA